MAEEDIESEAVVEEAKGGPGKKLLFGGMALLLLVAGGLAFMFLSPGAPDEAAGDQPLAAASKPALYTSLHPPLVVNFDDMNGATHFMQITMEVMARDQNVINAVREHTPVIRNNLILLYGNSVYEKVTTRAGKEQMLADGLAEIQSIMKERIGENGVEAVYFTSLIIQ
ncbi:MAG: flagellar basal body-associated FliL family protein [Gammaproteobacteria bacterium]|nr:flagellar basal body-associated FliL family protein [Gammaproteobacteria bacterium]MDH4313265.1 flagellar basal body-associated FliL family protein [Gammaproteobacteria bacterium]MDH5212934.1 flagellar basal body-associated FliL family protein [Gammaproteobacteria bacterium]